jgi:hypothetical protein
MTYFRLRVPSLLQFFCLDQDDCGGYQRQRLSGLIAVQHRPTNVSFCLSAILFSLRLPPSLPIRYFKFW